MTGQSWPPEYQDGRHTRTVRLPAVRPTPQSHPVQAAPVVAYPPFVQPPRQSVTRVRKQTNHLLHLILTCCTFGVWGIVWLSLTCWHRFGPQRKQVTTW